MSSLRAHLGYGWKYVASDKKQRIIKFDDGNEDLVHYRNEWIIFGEWKGKVALYNVQNPKVILGSISAWKVTQIK